MEKIVSEIKMFLLSVVADLNAWLSSTQLTTEQIALFSIFASILIFSLGKRYELRFKKHELKKEQYSKFIKLLEFVLMNKQKDSTVGIDEISQDLRKEFFDMGSSLLLYGSKKLYKQYVFYREFSENNAAKLSGNYDSSLSLYILAEMLKTIRKEVGLSYFSNISDVEILAFFVNGIASNPQSKIASFKARYQLKMVKLEIFIFDQLSFVVLKKIYYAILAPIIGILGLAYKYLLLIPLCKVILYLNPNALESISILEEKIKKK